MKAELSPEAIAIAHVVAQEEYRPALACVCIGNGEIAAADGCILVRHPVKIEGEGAILVPGKAILKAQELHPGIWLLEQSDDDVVLKQPYSNLALSTKVVEGHFPTLDNTYPTSEPVAFIALAPRLLRKLLDAVPGASIIKFRIRKPIEPVEFIAGDASGLIMPMSTPEDDEHWHKVEKI